MKILVNLLISLIRLVRSEIFEGISQNPIIPQMTCNRNFWPTGKISFVFSIARNSLQFSHLITKNMKIPEHPFSWKALIRILTMALFIMLAWKASDALVIILIAVVMAVSLHPMAKGLTKKTGLPFLASIFLVLIIILVPFVFLGFTFIPAFIEQFPDLLKVIGSIISSLTFLPPSVANFNIGEFLQANYSSLIASTQTVAMFFFNLLTVVIMAVYFIYEYDQLLELLLNLVPSKKQAKLKALLLEISDVMGKYIRGHLVIASICGITNYIGFSLIGIPFALPLAILCGILDLLPIVGQSIGAIPVLIIGFAISPLKGILVLILNITYQQVENAFIAPLIYKKVLKLYPSIIMISVVIGGSLFGVLGAFLALPVAAVIPVIIKYKKD